MKEFITVLVVCGILVVAADLGGGPPPGAVATLLIGVK